MAERLSARRVCQECGAIYRDSDIEAISGTCTNCGGDVVQRGWAIGICRGDKAEFFGGEMVPMRDGVLIPPQSC